MCYTYDDLNRFDNRGSTVAITDMNEAITDRNGLIYMRARYYSPEMRRFINADIVAGEISNAVTLNRYAYANANPVTFIDPLGLSVALTLGIMALGGLIVSGISAIFSVAEQKKTHGEVNWKEVAVDAAWGFVDGAISASPLAPVGKIVSDAFISIGNQMTDAYFDSENQEDGQWLKEIDPIQFMANVVLDTAFSATYIKEMRHKKILYQNLDVWENVKKRESRRLNSNVAKKRIKEAEQKIFDFCVPNTIKEALPDAKTFVFDVVGELFNSLYSCVTDYVALYGDSDPIEQGDVTATDDLTVTDDLIASNNLTDHGYSMRYNYQRNDFLMSTHLSNSV